MGYSTNGRPRRVTDADIAAILAWADSYVSCRQLADRLGLSVATVRRIVQSRGAHYKTESPESRAALRSESRVPGSHTDEL
jgi:IS30 family transposase